MVAQAAPAPPPAPPPVVLRGWVGLAVLLNAIWLITVVSTGHFLYYWPVWPMLATGVAAFMALGFAGSGSPDRDDRRAEYRAAREQFRSQRHALRHERHALRSRRRALRRGQVPPALPAAPQPPEQDLR